jgi:phenylacetate-coenzyme A ligase PaaK-like adenylate-forming protein
MTVLRLLPRFQKAYRELEVLKERESWTRGMIESFQLERLNSVWIHAVAHVPYYRSLSIRDELPMRFSSLTEFRSTVPVLSKSEVRTTPQWFLSEQRGRGQSKRTGGSTGTR